MLQLSSSVRQTASGANAVSCRTTSGVCVEGSRLTLPRQQARCEPDAEVITIPARVEHVRARPEGGRHPLHIAEELGYENRRAGAVGDHRVEGGMRNQRQRGQMPTSSCAR